MDKWKRRVAYPFAKSDVRDWISEIARCKETLNLALTADNTSSLQEILSLQRYLTEETQKTRFAIERLGATYLTNEQSKARERDLASLEVNARLDIYLESCELQCPNTGAWLLSSPEYSDWLASQTSVLWMKGIHGSGKTILASIVVSSLEKDWKDVDHGFAYFFCTYRDPASQNPGRILGCLAKQLAEQNADALEELRAFFDIFGSFRGRHECLPVKVLEQLVLKTSANFNSVRIVVDGLNECHNQANEVLNSLCHIQSDTKSSIALMILSRDEGHFHCPQGYSSLDIAARDDDLESYVSAELKRRISSKRLRITSPKLQSDISERLVKKADGMFQWVSCQLDYLCELQTEREYRQALDTLPPTLEKTYERMLTLLDEKPDTVRERIQRTLKYIHWSSMRSNIAGSIRNQDQYPPLSVAAICEAVSLDEEQPSVQSDNIPSEQALLQCCGSLIRKSGTARAYFDFSHFTAKEYLTKVRGSLALRLHDYGLAEDRTQIYRDFCIFSLRYLMLDDFIDDRPVDSLPDISSPQQKDHTNGRFAFREAAMGCLWHYPRDFAILANDDDEISHLTLRLLTGPTFISWAQYTWLKYRFTSEIPRDSPSEDCLSQSVFDDRATPLHYAAMLQCPSLCRALVDFGFDVNASCAFGLPLACATLGRLSMSILTIPDEAILMRQSVLEMAQIENRAEMLRSFVGLGANFNLEVLGGWTVLEYLYNTVGDLESVAVVFDHASSVGAEDVRSLPVAMAISRGLRDRTPEQYVHAAREVFRVLAVNSAGCEGDELVQRILGIQRMLEDLPVGCDDEDIIDNIVVEGLEREAGASRAISTGRQQECNQHRKLLTPSE